MVELVWMVSTPTPVSVWTGGPEVTAAQVRDFYSVLICQMLSHGNVINTIIVN